jgi:division protein CdvB (Snf7/Vps24/ESCRT-III family)
MNVVYINSPDFSFFSDAKLQLDKIISQLQSADYANFEHGVIEQYIKMKGMKGMKC